MPHVDSIGLGLSPSVTPLSYPGAPVPADGLLVGPWLYPVATPSGAANWFDALVQNDGGPLRDRFPHGPHPMPDVLRALGVAGPEQRRPVLAIGSNASPGQLLHKYTAPDEHTAPVVPISVVHVPGLAAAHSAHVSTPGYIPYAPVRVPGPEPHTHRLLWLTAEQLDVLDATEPNYTPAVLRAPQFPAVLDSGLPLPEFTLYMSRWGVLRFPETGVAPAGTQESVYTRLSALDWFRELMPESRVSALFSLQALRQHEHRRLRVRDALVQHHLAVDAGLS
ncbi:hypothetical protein [Kineosporia succinea]|uniref:Uncharacterized protein n=1 Tax=Kineosporia succinea TaxID=84632 RepID=A0ABT9NZT7_9ACTN|nr:hypothetical protein [Kineosporia succinea]MDP9825674.1 hypothetical protein [Kineosporia succinea]